MSRLHIILIGTACFALGLGVQALYDIDDVAHFLRANMGRVVLIALIALLILAVLPSEVWVAIHRKQHLAVAGVILLLTVSGVIFFIDSAAMHAALRPIMAGPWILNGPRTGKTAKSILCRPDPRPCNLVLMPTRSEHIHWKTGGIVCCRA